MQNYGKATAKAIVEPYCGDRFEVRDNGVWPIDADKCAWSVKDDDDSLQWKPSCELDGPDAPDPLETPSLPIPFTVNELAAFMLDGEGVTVSSAFGPWENGPDKGILESMGILATKAREAVVGAYAAYRDAQSVVGKRDLANEIQVARVVSERKQKMFEAQELRGEYWRKLGEAKKREKADEPDISENESQERCKRAEASVTDYRERLDHAEASVVEINERLKKSRQLARADLLPWRKAMVNYLQPPKSIGLDTIKGQPAPLKAESASDGVEQGLLTKDIAACFDDCYYSADNWPKRLSGTKWLETACIGRGEAGGASAVWNPLTLAQLMHHKTKGDKAKEKLMKALNSRFNINPALEPWRDAFNEYFATHCATD